MSEPSTDYRTLLKNALLKIKTMQAKLDALDEKKNEPIAVIGLGCRFPGGATNPNQFWQLLRDGVDAMCEIPKDRWDNDAYYDPEPGVPGKIYAREGGFLSDVDRFDAHFFNISPREAATMDPQQRLLLEVTWEALEQASILPSQLRNSQTGVFVGMMPAEYTLLTHYANQIDTYTGTGTDISMAAGRIAYSLGLHGPALTLDTACSSALVAVHLACQSLRNSECELAVAGGVNLILAPEQMIVLSRLQALSPGGRCRTFDAQADGMARGEGCGMVVLKRLSAAQADGDPIWAVIRGSAINHDGPASGLTVPNEIAQESLIQQALANAQVNPDEIGYVEAHGTGTKLGDPIEVSALSTIFAKERQDPLWIGSVKTNFGHLEAAAGIASLIKVILSLQHGEIPPSLHFETPNPHIDWAHLPMKVPTSVTEWPSLARTYKRIAGISSFGLSGTNAHLVIEAAPDPEPLSSEQPETEQPAHLLLLSAKSQPALLELAERYVEYLPNSSATLADICYTATLTREHFDHRVGIVATSKEELRERLITFISGEERQGVICGYQSETQTSRIAFLFTGQGSQHIHMGRELYETQPMFRQALNECNEILEESLGESLLRLIYPLPDDEQSAIQLLSQTDYAQPATFAIEYALAKLWQSWGVQPNMLIGHSTGEFAAACIAGVFSLEAGLKLVTERGRLIQSLPADGQTVSSMTSERTLSPLLEAHPGVSIAAINGPESLVISGRYPVMQVVLESLEALSIKTKLLNIPVAAHSPMMDPILDEFEQVVSNISLSPPHLPFVSSMSGQLASDDLTNPTYWRQQLRNPVRFADGMQTLSDLGGNIFLEIGSKPTLLGLGSQTLPDETLAWLPSLRPETSNWQQMLESLAHLYIRGAKIDWQGVYQAYPGRKVALPTYPFQHQPYWVSSSPQSKRGVDILRPLIDKMVTSPLHDATIFETEFSTERLPFLAEHRVYGKMISPGACQVALVLSAVEALHGVSAIQLEDIVLPAALVVPEQDESNIALDDPQVTRTVQLVLNASEQPGDNREFQLISFDPTEHAPSPIHHAAGMVTQTVTQTVSLCLDDLKAACSVTAQTNSLRHLAESQQIELGPSFQWVEALWRGEEQILAQLYLPETIGSLSGYVLHPCLLDACFQVACIPQDDGLPTEARLPFAIERLSVFEPAKGQAWWCHAQQNAEDKWTIHLLDIDGQLIAEIVGFEVRSASPQAVGGRESWKDWLYEVEWRPRASFGLKPDYLPTLLEFKQHLIKSTETIDANVQAERILVYQQAISKLEMMSVAYIVDAFEKLGATFQLGTSWQTEQLAVQLSIIPQQRRLFARLLDVLREEGILREFVKENRDWQVIQVPDINYDVAKLTTALQEHYGELLETELTLVRRCGEKLAQVLRGAQEPLDLLFPNGDATLVNRLYQDAPVSQLLNQQVQGIVQHALAHLPMGRGARILEVGAGTGSTTAALLPHLSAEQAEYLFTDLGPTFIQAAQEKFGDFPFVTYHILDIEQDPISQGFGHRQYDIIIAANVLHATQDLAQSLTHVRSLLAPHGLLILIEQTQANHWVDLTFGMTEGWWRFADTEWRANHPLLDASKWAKLLNKCGFESVQAMPNAAQSQESVELGQSVIIARADANILPLNRSWFIVADDIDDGLELATRLRQSGELPILLLPTQNDTQRQISADTSAQQNDLPIHTFNPNRVEDVAAVLRRMPIPEHVVLLWGNIEDPFISIEELQMRSEHICRQTLHTVQALLAEYAEPPQLWLVTRGAQAVDEQDKVPGVAQSLLWGMGKVIALEHSELDPIYIDLAPDDEMDALWAELTASPLSSVQRDNQLALRRHTRYVARLTRHADSQAQLPPLPFRLAISERGLVENLHLQPVTRQAPGPNEIEIRVHATGLNFVDILDALGMLPFERRSDEFGGECAGEVVAVGEMVEQFQVGDRVVALAFGGFASHYTTPATLAIPMPDHLSFTEAATIPANFLTAYYALYEVAQMQAGDKVLIHAAAGGTGMAAIQLAQRAGAKIFATASPSKWETLQQMGIDHIYHSRTLDFAQQILTDTNGRGVDIVLNSLTGEGFIDASLFALAEQGRFIEIAKRDVWGAEQITAQRPDVTFHFVDLRRVSLEEPERVQTMFQQLMQWFVADSPILQPLPFKSFPIQDVASAFRIMQQAKHIGKIVVTQPVEESVMLDEAATYLVVGGLGGIGLLTAQWLATKGARHLLLIGRSSPTAEVQAQLDALREGGVDVIVAQADVSKIDQVANVLNGIDEHYPLRGIIHSAGVLDDGIFTEQSWERFARVLGPKVWGAWNLHHLTQQMPLDFFVLYASAAGLLGSAGQANHSAANAFLDAFAHMRRAQGLPTLAIDWGAWSEVGEAARRADAIKLQAGMGVIDPKRGMAILDYLFTTYATQVGVLPIQWSKYKTDTPFMADFQQEAQAHTESQYQTSLLEELKQSDLDQQHDLLTAHLQIQVAYVLGHQTQTVVATSQPFAELGMDSLMSVELRNRLQRTFECRLPSTLIFEYPSIDALVTYLADEVLQLSSPLNGVPALLEQDEELSLDNDLADMSDAEIEALLAQELMEIDEAR